MSGGTFFWNGATVPFRDGETIAVALTAHGVAALGHDEAGAALRYFCGIGACQNCLVRIDGRILESCLTPATTDARVTSVGGGA